MGFVTEQPLVHPRERKNYSDPDVTPHHLGAFQVLRTLD